MKQHAELHLLFSMITPVGWLERVPTYKEKRDLLEARTGGGDESISYGLLGYPCLQAADILIYRAHPCRSERIRRPIWRSAAKSPAASIASMATSSRSRSRSSTPTTGVIPGIDGRKMSKSYGNAIFIADGPDAIAEKVKNAFTTPTKIRKTDPGVPETAWSASCAASTIPQFEPSWEEDRAGVRGCMQNKKELTELLVNALAPMRARREELLADPAELDRILEDGADRARAAAEATMQVSRRHAPRLL